MFTQDERFQDPRRETALKRKLIQDPDQSFWDGPRPKLGVTLGEAVVFSILCLLIDAQRTMLDRGRTLVNGRSATLRFSHPNWITEDNVRALECYRDAVVVATSIFLEGLDFKSGPRSINIAADALRSAVQRHRVIMSRLRKFPSQYTHREYLDCSTGSINGTTWELVFESCAAGFPYVLEGEYDTFESELRKFPATRRIRKILVVDVGAGSTDAGYLVRTIRPRNVRGIMKPLLIWLPAADALEVAGRWLTDKILADFKQQGRHVTAAEAEDYKISSQIWYEKPYVREWTALIADHVAEYVRGICDEICLPNNPELEVVLTGGSSVVEPLRDETLRQVRSALRRRGIGEALSDATKLIEVAHPESLGRSYRAVEVAQLAVSLGASDPRLADLKAYPEGLVMTQFVAGL